MKKLADRQVAADVYAVQQIYALRRGRFEINPYWSQSLNDQFVGHPGPGLAVNYYLTNVLAVGVNGTYYQPFNSDADFNFENRRATRLAVPLNEYLGGYAVNFTYVPMYGKFSGFGNFIFHYDGYLVGGVGGLFTRPIAVIDPDNRKFDFEHRIAFNVGFGLRIFLNRWFSVIGEIRDYIYIEQLENTQVAATQAGQQDRNTWFGEKPLTNNVQAQIGISMFLPFSWEYRLPK
ncbi:MAG: outer membrane beta-barrel domain-containing protein [Myxococcales bacterium 68-20]|nr:MAG: outer membrane beta-barrel domain-containing protein [Myxococcales bacterium 68-20]